MKTILVFIIGFLAVSLGVYLGGTKMQQRAIERHAAEYNATTGEFEWLK